MEFKNDENLINVWRYDNDPRLIIHKSIRLTGYVVMFETKEISGYYSTFELAKDKAKELYSNMIL